MDEKERCGKTGFRKSVRHAKKVAQDKRKKLAEAAQKRADEEEDERVRKFNRRQAELLGEKFDDD